MPFHPAFIVSLFEFPRPLTGCLYLPLSSPLLSLLRLSPPVSIFKTTYSSDSLAVFFVAPLSVYCLLAVLYPHPHPFYRRSTLFLLIAFSIFLRPLPSPEDLWRGFDD